MTKTVQSVRLYFSTFFAKFSDKCTVGLDVALRPVYNCGVARAVLATCTTVYQQGVNAMKVDLSEKEVDLVGKHAMEAVLMEARSRTTETWKAIARKLLGLTQVK